MVNPKCTSGEYGAKPFRNQYVLVVPTLIMGRYHNRPGLPIKIVDGRFQWYALLGGVRLDSGLFAAG